MNAPDLKLSVSLNTKELSALPAGVQKANQQVDAENKRAAADALRIQQQAAQAEAAVVLDKFDRRIAVERVKHAQILEGLKDNNAAQEAEIRRHNAVVARLQMDKGNLPNTPFQQLLGGMSQSMGVADGMMGMAGMAAGALGAALAINKIGEAIHNTVEAAMDMQTIHQTLDFASGSAEKGAKNFKFLSDQAMTLGISLKDSAPEFARMQAAAMGTSLAGKGVQDVFKSMSEAAVTLHLDTDSTSRGFYALREMMEMTTVQTRQMRMLALAIPGAFQDAAKAMGTTTEGLMTMMKHGQVMTDDFLPKFAEVMHKKFEEPAVDASQNARQELQKFGNEIFETAARVGGPLLQIAGGMAKAFTVFTGYTQDAKELREEMERLQKATGSVAFNPEMTGNMFRGDIEAQARKNIEARRVAKQADDIDRLRTQDNENVNLARLEKQVEERERLEEELQVSLAAAREDGEGKKVAEEERRYAKEKEKIGSFHDGLELAEKIHTANLLVIHQEYAKKAQEESDKEFEKATRDFEAAHKKEVTALGKKFEDQLKLVESAHKKLAELQKTNEKSEVKDKTASPADREAALEKERLAALQAIQDEYAKNGFEKTKTYEELVLETKRDYANKAIALKKEEAKLEQEAFAGTAKITSQGLNVIMGLYHKHGAEYKVWAEAKNVVDTALSAQAAYESAASIPFVGFVMAPIAAGLAIAAGAENASKIASAHFANGTDYAPGGMALVGEQGPEMVYLPRGSQVKTASETRNMMGSTFAPNITIHMASGTSAADAHAIADTVDARLRNLAKDLQEIDYRGIRA